jgi:hypothetical protein
VPRDKRTSRAAAFSAIITQLVEITPVLGKILGFESSKSRLNCGRGFESDFASEMQAFDGFMK